MQMGGGDISMSGTPRDLSNYNQNQIHNPDHYISNINNIYCQSHSPRRQSLLTRPVIPSTQRADELLHTVKEYCSSLEGEVESLTLKLEETEEGAGRWGELA